MKPTTSATSKTSEVVPFRQRTRRKSVSTTAGKIPNPVIVWIDESQSPEAVGRDLARSLRTRRMHHKFHYDTLKQTVRWLAIYKQYSPFPNDPACQKIYRQAFDASARRVHARRIHVIGLGCGNGEKDIRLAETLRRAGKTVSYTPSDVSTPMTLVAWRRATRRLGGMVRPPLVCDLATTTQLRDLLRRAAGPQATKLITFLGMIPNFEAGFILPRLAASMARGDLLLASGNLLPGPDPAKGLRRVLPQYDNPLTRRWLFTVLSDLGVGRADGRIHFKTGAKNKNGETVRIEARFRFLRSRTIQLPGSSFTFDRGESLRLFFSVRYTSQSLRQMFARHGFQVLQDWVAPSGEEGVFLLKKA